MPQRPHRARDLRTPNVSRSGGPGQNAPKTSSCTRPQNTKRFKVWRAWAKCPKDLIVHETSEHQTFQGLEGLGKMPQRPHRARDLRTPNASRSGGPGQNAPKTSSCTRPQNTKRFKVWRAWAKCPKDLIVHETSEHQTFQGLEGLGKMPQRPHRARDLRTPNVSRSGGPGQNAPKTSSCTRPQNTQRFKVWRAS